MQSAASWRRSATGHEGRRRLRFSFGGKLAVLAEQSALPERPVEEPLPAAAVQDELPSSTPEDVQEAELPAAEPVVPVEEP